MKAAHCPTSNDDNMASMWINKSIFTGLIFFKAGSSCQQSMKDGSWHVILLLKKLTEISNILWCYYFKDEMHILYHSFCASVYTWSFVLNSAVRDCR